jgi:hypothetical protein
MIQAADRPRKLAIALENNRKAIPLRNENTPSLNRTFLRKEE